MNRSFQRSLWRQRNFLLLWGGQGISIIGTMLSGIARPFLVFQLGGGSREVGIVLALTSVPYLLLALPAGAWIDRWDRKRTMIICDIGRGLVLALLVGTLASGHATIALIDLTTLGEGICTVFFELAETASLPQVVAPEQLSEALNYNQALYSLAFVVGPPVGGLLFTLNPLLPFAGDALTFVVSVVTLGFITVPFQRSRPAQPSHLIREIRDGLAWLWHEPRSRYLTLRSSLVNLVLGATALVIIRLVAHALPPQATRSVPTFTGILLTGAGIGGIVGVVVCARIIKRFPPLRLIEGALWLQGVIFVLLIVPGYVGLVALVVVSYGLWPIHNAALNGYRLALIPDAMQGRVNSVYSLFGNIASPSGTVLISMLLAQTGIVATAIMRGLLLLGIALLNTIMFARFKKERAA